MTSCNLITVTAGCQTFSKNSAQDGFAAFFALDTKLSVAYIKFTPLPAVNCDFRFEGFWG